MRHFTILLLATLPLNVACSDKTAQVNRDFVIAFGSCADMGEVTDRTWNAIVLDAPDAMVTLGDTPYIDSTDPDRQRQRYETFSATAGFQAVTQATTLYGTWDDHDFGRNDTDGNLEGKEHSRAAFVAHYERFGNATFGNGSEGVYTKFTVGNMEVFLLDTRYFAGTAASQFDPEEKTLLGIDQWKWLRGGLKSSEADFKVLSCGMIWNGSVRPGKPDHWGSYPAEYDALMSFIGDNQIDGVVLVGGDIHRSRCILHNTKESAGYDIPEFITSPMHDHIISTANQPHPGLQFDTGSPNSYLLLEASSGKKGSQFAARFMAVPKKSPKNSKEPSPGKELYVSRHDLELLSSE
ncbi:MAG: alkaline phosphatase D family protein [Planctomycetota bacterium]|nr:alkaline phosphatase D family protein [Planctomycetota bacterium]